MSEHGSEHDGTASAVPSARSLFNEAAIAMYDGKSVVVEHHLSHTIRRGRVVSLTEGEGPYERQGSLLVQWYGSHSASTIRAADLRAPRYSIRVVER